MPSLDHTKIAIIGLSYDRLPLAVEIGKHYDNFDLHIRAVWVDNLRTVHDQMNGVMS